MSLGRCLEHRCRLHSFGYFGQDAEPHIYRPHDTSNRVQLPREPNRDDQNVKLVFLNGDNPRAALHKNTRAVISNASRCVAYEPTRFISCAKLPRARDGILIPNSTTFGVDRAALSSATPRRSPAFPKRRVHLQPARARQQPVERVLPKQTDNAAKGGMFSLISGQIVQAEST